MATWLAADQLDFRGAWSVASGWLRRAHRLLDPLEPGPEHGWLAFHEGFLAHAARDTATASGLAGRAAELGRRCGVADLEMLGLALEGATLVGCGRVEEGMRCLDEATATALGGDAAIPISGAWTFCFLVGACTSVLDFERASEWCDRIAGFAERYGSRYMLAFCRAEYGAVQVWRGRWGDAEAMLEASVEDFAGSRPAWVGGPLVGLAELRRRQGRPRDAERLLDRAGASAKAHLCRARLALDAGRTRQAVDLLERLLRQVPPDARARSRAGAGAARPRPRGAGRARRGGRGRRGAARRAAARGHGGDAGVRRRGRRRARARPRRRRARPRPARGRGRRPRAQRRAVRGGPCPDRARHVPDRARPGRRRARGGRGARAARRAGGGARRGPRAAPPRRGGRRHAAGRADAAGARGARACSPTG